MDLSTLLISLVATATTAVVVWMCAMRWLPQTPIADVATLPRLSDSAPAEGGQRDDSTSGTDQSDMLGSIELEALADSRLSTIVSDLGERLASADITIFVRTPVELQLDRAWIAVPGGGAARPHLEVDDASFETDSDGRCLKQKPAIRVDRQEKVSIFHSWVPKGVSVAESDESVPVMVTLDVSAPGRGARRRVRLLCQLGRSSENRLYIEQPRRQLLQRVFERHVVSLQLVTD